MIYSTPEHASQAYATHNPHWELGEAERQQIAIGVDALTASGFDRIHGVALTEAGDSKAGKDRILYKYQGTFRYFSGHQGYAALVDHVRGLGGELAKVSAATGLDMPTPQSIIKAIFPIGSVLNVAPHDANLLIGLALDALHAVLGQSKAWAGALPVVPDDVLAEQAPALYAVLNELNTHDSKQLFVSSKGKAFLPGGKAVSRFLTASAVPDVITWPMGGGKMQYGGAAGYLLTPVLQIDGLEQFPLFMAFKDAELRKKLRAHGITAMDRLPELALATPQIDMTFVGCVRMKLSATESLEMAVIPSGNLLATLCQLDARVSQLAQASAQTKARQYLFECFGPEQSELIEAVLTAENGKDRAKAVSQLEALPALVKFNSRKLNWLLYSHTGAAVTVPITSKAQLAGAVYTDKASKGIPRFAAALDTRQEQNPQAIRRYHVADATFARMLAEETPQGDPTEAYQVGVKWLGNRVQAQIRSSYVNRAAAQFAKCIRKLRSWVRLQPSHVAQLNPEGATLAQRLLLGLELSDSDKQTLAGMAAQLLNSADAAAHAELKQCVINSLEKQ